MNSLLFKNYYIYINMTFVNIHNNTTLQMIVVFKESNRVKTESYVENLPGLC